jgi:MprA protease rhombosortase-interaction domain-containing protein
MRTPRAFTIVELITALVLLAVGLAAFARAAGAVARLERDAHIQRLIAATLRARLDSLTQVACGSERAGDTTHDGIRERWHAASQGRHIVLDLQIDATARPSLSRRLSSAVPCTP